MMLRGPIQRVLARVWAKEDDRRISRDFRRMYERGQLDDAYALLSAAVDDSPGLSQIGDVYVMFAHLDLMVAHDVARAMEHLDKAWKLGSRVTDFYLQVRGYALWHAGERQAALECFEKAVVIERSVYNLTQFAAFLSETNDERAGAVLSEILDRDPNNCTAHIYAGQEAAKSGDADGARVFAEKAWMLRPHADADDLCQLGKLCCTLNDFPAAIEAYLAADKLGWRGKAALYAAVAHCYLSLHNVQKAHEYMDRALALDGEDEFVKDIWQEYQTRLQS
jgi:tetratricopeptide (TPR) repeat protein